MPMTCNCPACGCLLQLPEEHVGKRVICPKCTREFSGSAAPAVSEAIEPSAQHDFLPRGAVSDNSPYVTEHPRETRRFQHDEEDEDHPEEQSLDHGLPGRGRAIALIVL